MNARDDDRDRADWGADPELLVFLRHADPARSLPPLPAADLHRLAAAAIEADQAAAVAARPSTHRARPTRRLAAPLVAAAALVVLAGAGVSGVLGVGPFGADRPSRTSGSSPQAAPAGPVVLTVPEAVTGRCAVPSAEMLAEQQIAFEGTVTSLADGVATLTPTTVFAGAVSDEVVVQAPGEQMSALLSAVQFETGRSYLVSATDGRLTLCGYSAPAGAGLRSLYQQAFAG